MYIVSAPEKPYLGSSKTRTLAQAIRTKNAWQYNLPGTQAIITDRDGYVVSSREQYKFLAGYGR